MPEKLCPQLSGPDLDGNLVKVPCQEHACSWYIQIQGQHPQTGEMLNEWGCAIAWGPTLQIETSQQTRQAGAAVESLRNEVHQQQEAATQVFLDLHRQQGRIE